jgi:hypothetical protein
MTKIYHTLEDGEIVELRNWMMEPSAGDCVIVRPLDEGDKTKYYILKDLGLTDSQVFFRLNPKILDRIEKRKSVEVPVEILDEKQLIWLIENRIGEKMESLDRLSKRDLVKLFLTLSK